MSEEKFQLANSLHQAGRLEEAVALYREVAEEVTTLNLAVRLGEALASLGEYAQAEHWMGQAARHRPGEPFIRRALGDVYSNLGKVDLAEGEYRAALELAPEHGPARVSLAALLLSVGRYAEAWPLWEERIRLYPAVVPPFTLSWPEWRGEPLAGRSILIWYEQGFGDQIQFCRFAASLKAQGAGRVVLCCRPALVSLLAVASGVDEVVPVPRDAVATVPSCDTWTRYFSMPLHLGVTLETLPNEPYLSAPEDRRERWDPTARVGLAWKASPTGFNGRYKGLPPEEAQRLFDLGVMSLDPEATGVADFADTAAILEKLDLVISIDTSVAHLAGAMDRPCWTLLPRTATDWRWLRDRRDSPWYPSMRLYRQAEPGNWAPIVSEVIRDLAAAGLARA